jgi:hypothetical protein
LERQQHLAISAIGALLQRERSGVWRLRGSAQDVQAAWKQLDDADWSYHDQAAEGKGTI